MQIAERKKTSDRATERLDFTVAIVTYNSAERLPTVLEKLRSQIGTESIRWEVSIVDNNSTDDTARVIRSYQGDRQFPVAIHYHFEPRQGAAFARKRAIRAARSPLIGFLDDDNLPNENWLAAAVRFAREYPNAGAYGSQIHGDYEVEPPPNFERIKAFLAITERGDRPLVYDPKLRFLPPSAGLVIRRSAWLENVPETCILTGRTAKSALTSEDLEALSYLQLSSWEIWYNPEMEIDHQIPSKRLTRKYLIAHLGGIGLSRYITRTVGVHSFLKPFLTLLHLLNDSRKILFHIVKYGRKTPRDTIAACERELLIQSWISPFYFYLKDLSVLPQR
ncbi:hormogonium polysaccharide biosynthesis glycosyltransferase HpsE [Pannus brasiliensis CCIBt3594]|uniref:Hormogonium polysaccharide biosynthesis glycosyltransferase HpsE n=1 Tax=Pannus brasiliensis CCIBt3594 TaxID=1427578 RepID=A0AAW9QZH0_9CHRO